MSPPVAVLNPNGVSPRSPGLATKEPTLVWMRTGGFNPNGVASTAVPETEMVS